MLLKHCFLFSESECPILGIEIESCKIVADDDKHTMIYLDRAETRKFLKRIDDTLDSKATNITRKYAMNSFSGPELRDLAESLDPDSLEDMITVMERRIEDMNSEAEKVEAKGKVELIKAGFQFAKDITHIILKFTPKKQITAKTSAVLETVSNQLEYIFSEDQVNEFVQVEKSLTEDYAADQSNKDRNAASSSGAASKTVKLASTGKGVNCSKIAQLFENLKLKPKEYNSATEGLICLLESKRIIKQIELLKKRVVEINKNKEYIYDFINMVKMYIKLSRERLERRSDYEGVLVEEIKKEQEGGNHLLREYKVRVVQ